MSDTQTNATRAEITKIPWWVFGVLGVGLLCAALDAPNFSKVLHDAVEKRRAEKLVDAGHADQAAPIYSALHAQYPANVEMTMALGLAQHRAGLCADALATFTLLDGQKFSSDEIERLDAATLDCERKLKAAGGDKP